MNPIPIVAILVIALFAFALIREARRQQSAARSMFEQLASARGWQFLELDDGTLEPLLSGMEAIGILHSPSLGKRTPSNVAAGRVAEGRAFLFQHSLRIDEGYALEWNVCLIETERALCDSLVLRFLRGSAASPAALYRHAEIPLDPEWKHRVAAYGADPERAAPLLRPDVLRRLAEGAERLPWRVDLQVRGRSVAAYLAERNASPESPEQLAQLLEFTRDAVRCRSSC